MAAVVAVYGLPMSRAARILASMIVGYQATFDPDYNISLAGWVGVIALAGLDAETGLVMLLYLDNSFERFRADGRIRDQNDL